jgi:hypothetical protein
MLVQARDIFEGLGDARAAVDTVGAVAEAFAVDALQLRYEAALASGKSAALGTSSKADRQCAVPVLAEVADAAWIAHRFALADTLDSCASSLATETEDPELLKEVADHLRERSEGQAAWNKAYSPTTQASAVATRLAQGKFLCLIVGDWHAGLPLLAVGSDAELAAAARTELSGQASAAADAWLSYATGPDGAAQQHPLSHRQLVAHAAALYTAAEPTASGLLRQKIRRRLEGISNEPPAGVVHPRIDLLRGVDPAGDAVSGHWDQAPGGGLAGEAQELGRIEIPYTPTSAYELQVTFARTGGNGALGLYCLGNGRQFTYLFGAYGNTLCGIDLLNKKYANSNGSAVHGVSLINGRRTEVAVRITSDVFEAYLDLHSIYRYKTDYSDLSLPPEYVLRRPDCIGLAVNRSSYEIYSAVAVELVDRRSPPPRSDVKILAARWGDGTNWADVTERVSELWAARVAVWANCDMLGADPAPGWRKHLEVKYSWEGKSGSISVDEDQPLRLPRDYEKR